MLKSITCAFVALIFSATAMAQEGPRVLLLTKSAGFQHGAVKNDKDGNNHVSNIMQKLCDENGATLVSTKDARLINELTLERFDLVIFYTTGDLTISGGSDGSPGMSDTGVAELTKWIENGGGFIGFHCATDTFHTNDEKVSPYTKLIGAQFKTHGKQFKGSIKVVDPTHPTMAETPQPWVVNDEYYVFNNLNKKNIHVLAMLETGEEGKKQDKYAIPSYPIIWCSQEGKGRVYYTVQGHREDVWTNPDFQNNILLAAYWALGNGPAQAKPNYKKVVK